MIRSTRQRKRYPLTDTGSQMSAPAPTTIQPLTHMAEKSAQLIRICTGGTRMDVNTRKITKIRSLSPQTHRFTKSTCQALGPPVSSRLVGPAISHSHLDACLGCHRLAQVNSLISSALMSLRSRNPLSQCQVI